MGRIRFAISCCSCVILLFSADRAAAASLTVAWDPEPTAVGYVVSYGTQSGTYSSSADAGSQTIRQVDGLADGTMYYFVVRSYDSAGRMSAPSIEVAGMTSGLPSGPPLIECPAPIASSSDGKPVVVTFAPAFSGGTAPLTASCSPASGSLFPVGSTPSTCTVVDSVQQQASCSTSVVVTSGSPAPAGPPTISCPVPSGTSGNGKPVVLTFAPTVSGGTSPVASSCVPASGSQFPVGTTALTCTAIDAARQSASCNSTAVVTSSAPGHQPPVPTAAALDITCPPLTSVVSHSGNPVKVSLTPIVSGGVAPVTAACEPQSGSSFAVGITPVTCTVTDAVHEVDSCATSVIVTSTKGPSPIPIPTGEPTEFDAAVVLSTGKCPAATLTVSTLAVSELKVTTSATTNYAKGACSALAPGKQIHVQGLKQPDDSIVATSITFRK